MVANVLNSARAIQMSLVVIRAFVAMRQLAQEHKALATKVAEMDARLRAQPF
jgi:hypothetical protein